MNALPTLSLVTAALVAALAAPVAHAQRIGVTMANSGP
ncbi:MAG: hypothetical protein RLY78_1958 [Pseudomonadota bacterium]